MSLRFLGCGVALGGALCFAAPVRAQSFRFDLRAEPDVIPANGLSTTSIFVQVPQGSSAITPVQNVRFATTAGSIESSAMLSGGVARVLLRSSNVPGTATVTAFIGNARETTTVEFSEDTGLSERYLEVAAPYVAYGNVTNIITSSGACSLNFGDLHIESDVRLDVDLATERIWAQGNAGGVRIRSGRGAKSVELRGDRLFYDLHRRRGVMRRSEGDASNGPRGARQEFSGAKFGPLPAPTDEETAELSASKTKAPAPAAPLLAPPSAPTSSEQGRANLSLGASASPPTEAPAAPDAKEPTTPLTAPATAPDSAPASGNSSASKEDSPASQGNSSPSPKNPSSSKENSSPSSPSQSPTVPGSLADTPAPLVAQEGNETRSNPLVAQPKPVPDAGPGLQKAPAYQPLPDDGPAPRIVELLPPGFDVTDGYWVTSRRLRVFPRDKVQFERARIYFNGQKAFSLPLYVLPLDGSFNPTTDILALNSRGGVSLHVPFAYQASAHGTGTLYLENGFGGGFGTRNAGPSLTVQQQYWLNSRSHGNFSVDQIGRGDFNVNFAHEQQLDNRTVANLFVNAPRHRDLFTRASVQRTLSGMQVGFEGFFDRPEGQVGQLRGQFFARMQPKKLGHSGWQFALSANTLGVGHVAYFSSETSAGRGGGGIGLPGTSPGNGALTRYRSLIGETLGATVSSPTYSPWRGSNFSANLLATAYNYSDGRRGLAPGVNLAFNQAVGKGGNLLLGYTFDRSSAGLYGATGNSFTHYFTAALNANLTPKISASGFVSRSLSDQSVYGSAGVDYLFAPKWRIGAFLDYAHFVGSLTGNLNTGWSLGRTLGNRELSLNFDSTRRKLYFQYGGLAGAL